MAELTDDRCCATKATSAIIRARKPGGAQT